MNLKQLEIIISNFLRKGYKLEVRKTKSDYYHIFTLKSFSYCNYIENWDNVDNILLFLVNITSELDQENVLKIMYNQEEESFISRIEKASIFGKTAKKRREKVVADYEAKAESLFLSLLALDDKIICSKVEKLCNFNEPIAKVEQNIVQYKKCL